MMPTSETGVSNSGFTLLEMMVVLVIMGITLTMVTLSFRAPGTRPLAEQAHHLVMALNTARDEAELEGKPILFRLDLQGWHFYVRGTAGLTEMTNQTLPAGQFNPSLQDMQLWPADADHPGAISSLELWIEPAHFHWQGLVIHAGEQRAWLKSDGLGGVTVEAAP